MAAVTRSQIAPVALQQRTVSTKRSRTQVPLGSSKKYVMTGWYAGGSTWETWTATAPSTTPPSGHSLTNVAVVVAF